MAISVCVCQYDCVSVCMHVCASKQANECVFVSMFEMLCVLRLLKWQAKWAYTTINHWWDNRPTVQCESQCELPYFICYMHRYLYVIPILFIVSRSLSHFVSVSVLFSLYVYIHVFVSMWLWMWMCMNSMRDLVSGFVLEIQLKLYQDQKKKFNAVWIGFIPLIQCVRVYSHSHVSLHVSVCEYSM